LLFDPYFCILRFPFVNRLKDLPKPLLPSRVVLAFNPLVPYPRSKFIQKVEKPLKLPPPPIPSEAVSHFRQAHTVSLSPFSPPPAASFFFCPVPPRAQSPSLFSPPHVFVVIPRFSPFPCGFNLPQNFSTLIFISFFFFSSEHFSKNFFLTPSVFFIPLSF